MELTLLTVVNQQETFAVNNALKNVAMTLANTVSWIVYAIKAPIYWSYVLPLMVANIIGGYLGPIIVCHVPGRLMEIIVGIGSLILTVSLVARNMGIIK